MIQHLEISDCSREERQWLFMITWRIYTKKCDSTEEEQKQLIRRMHWVRSEDRGKLLDLNAYLQGMPLDPPGTLTSDKAQALWLEVIRICSLQEAIPTSQMKLIVYVGKVLGFEREAMEPAMQTVAKMAQLEREKSRLRQILSRHYRRRGDKSPKSPLSPYEAKQIKHTA